MLDEQSGDGLEVWGVRVAVSREGIRAWPAELKNLAVQKVGAGAKISEIADELGVRPALVSKWIKAARSKDATPAFVEVMAPANASLNRPALSHGTGQACVLRLVDVEISVPKGFPSDELAGILRAVRGSQ